MRLVASASCVASIVLVLAIGSAHADPPMPERMPLTFSAHQDNGLSLEHAWTAELNGDVLSLVRPGKKQRVRHLKRQEIDGLRRVLEAAQFASIPERLGISGSCDDCSRCRLVVDIGIGAHKVERSREGETDELANLTDDDRRFRDVWRAVKAVAGLTGVPDACW